MKEKLGGGDEMIRTGMSGISSGPPTGGGPVSGIGVEGI